MHGLDETYVRDALNEFRVDPLWRHEGVCNKPTQTPGVFYHGSNYVNISNFKIALDAKIGAIASPVFFTECPTFAALAAAKRGCGYGGRVYRSELITENPFIADAEDWCQRLAGDHGVEAEACTELLDDGYDAVISIHTEGTIFEIIALADRVIMRRDREVKRLVEWTSSKAHDALTFWCIDDLPAPNYPAGCQIIFGKRKHANAQDEKNYRVVVNAVNPVYCNQNVWPRLDLDVLRHASIDILVDPVDGRGLVLDPTKIVPLNRDQRRMLGARQRRR